MEGTKFTDPELVAMAPNLMKEIASLQSEIDKLKKDKDDIENTLRDLLKENAILTGELRQYALRRDLDVNSLKKEKTDLQSEIDRLKEERQELVKAVKAFVDIKTTSVNGVVLVDANNKAEREAIQNLITRIK